MSYDWYVRYDRSKERAVLRESSFLALVFRKSFHLEAKRRRARGVALSNGLRGGETARVVLCRSRARNDQINYVKTFTICQWCE